jgi:uncharacterized protein YeaO (DUF488 family)
MIKLKRAYEPAGREDGYRVLIDRLGPRGIKKKKLILDEWEKGLAPSTELRKSFGHNPAKWSVFRARYKLELHSPPSRKKVESLARRARRGTVTLIYSARDEDHNDAVVLKSVLDRVVDRVS